MFAVVCSGRFTFFFRLLILIRSLSLSVYQCECMYTKSKECVLKRMYQLQAHCSFYLLWFFEINTSFWWNVHPFHTGFYLHNSRNDRASVEVQTNKSNEWWNVEYSTTITQKPHTCIWFSIREQRVYLRLYVDANESTLPSN